MRSPESVDVVTYEFENVDVAAVERIATIVPVRPGGKATGGQPGSDDRKIVPARPRHCRRLPSWRCPTASSLEAGIAALGLPAIVKTRRFGYDGKGQTLIRSIEDVEAALAAVTDAPAILEGFVSFTGEISVIGVRGADGATATYDVADNSPQSRHPPHFHRPARNSATSSRRRQGGSPGACLSALDYVGVIGVEFFVCRRGQGSAAAGQRVCPARAQFRPLDHRCLRGVPVREPYPRRRRVAARPD